MFSIPTSDLPPLPPLPDFNQNTIIKQPDYTEPRLFTTPPVSCWTAFIMESPEKANDTVKSHLEKREDLTTKSANFSYSIQANDVHFIITIYKMNDGKGIALSKRIYGCVVTYNSIYNSIEKYALENGAEKTSIKAI